MRRIVSCVVGALVVLGAAVAAPMAGGESAAVAESSAGDGSSAVDGSSGTPMGGSAPGARPAQPYIVGGEQSSISQYPWMVALTTPASEAAYCGGVLVAPDKVLTAAHCVSGYRLSNIRVIAGRTDLRTEEGEERLIQRAWVHPSYRSPERGDDVAVVTLDQAVPYSTLPLETDHNAYPPGRRAIVLGWGYTSESGPSSPTLRSAEIPLIADSDCAAIYREFDPRVMVCAGDPGGGMDACYGDSGGPLVAGGRVIGITSWGSGCARANTPGVFVRIASYADQLNAQLGPTS